MPDYLRWEGGFDTAVEREARALDEKRGAMEVARNLNRLTQDAPIEAILVALHNNYAQTLALRVFRGGQWTLYFSNSNEIVAHGAFRPMA